MGKRIWIGLGLGISLIVLFFWRGASFQVNQGEFTSKRQGGYQKLYYDRPGQAMDYWQALLGLKPGDNPYRMNEKAIQQWQRQSKTIGAPPLAMSFEELGPGNFGGRIRSVVIHPEETHRILVGGVSGGLFRSEDDGQSWQRVGGRLPNLAIACLVLDPLVSDRVYAGTGEGFFNSDAARGNGIMVSEDFGSTWRVLPSTQDGRFDYVNRLAILGTGGDLLAATQMGIFRSEDEGVTWEDVSPFASSNRGYVDLKVDPADETHLLAYHYGANSGESVSGILEFLSPEGLLDPLLVGTASFGPSLAETGALEGQVVGVVSSGNALGCDPIDNPQALSGNIALVDRGICTFVDKVKAAQNAGAVAVMVVNQTESIAAMGGSDPSITIPSVMVPRSVGNAIRAQSTSVRVRLSGQTSRNRVLVQSRDGGRTFAQLGATEGLPVTDIGRMEIGFGSDGTVYLAVANLQDQTRGLWKSENGGQSFQQTPSSAQFIERQGWYDLAVGVHPLDSDIVFLGAVDVFRSRDGGSQILQIAKWAPGGGELPQYVHADIHAFAFDPKDAETIYIACDGGLFRSRNGGETYSSLNVSLNLAQNYGLAVHPSKDLYLTGTQDNGTHLFFGDREIWLEIWGGDGGYCAWDQQEPDYVYFSNPSGGMTGWRFGAPEVSSLNFTGTSGAPFIQPFALDANDGNRMLVGTGGLYFSQNVRALDQAIWSSLATAQGFVSALAFHPFDPNAFFFADVSNSLHRVDLVNGTPNHTSVPFPYSRNLVTALVWDERDASGQTYYVLQGGYGPHGVCVTRDGGQTFTSIQGDLPELPYFHVLCDPSHPNRLFLASEQGLWVGQLESGSEAYQWWRYEGGIPLTRVVALAWDHRDRLLVATHGRGTFLGSASPVMVTSTLEEWAGDGDGFLDTGERHRLFLSFRASESIKAGQYRFQLVGSPPEAGIEVLTPGSDLPALMAGEDHVVAIDFSQFAPLPAPTQGALNLEILSNMGPEISFSFPLTLNADFSPIVETLHFGESSSERVSMETRFGESAFTLINEGAVKGSFVYFGNETDHYSESVLTFPELKVGAPDAAFTFQLAYDLEGDALQLWDGAVMEYCLDGGDWVDAGALVSGVPYDGSLFKNSTLFIRDAWSGKRRTFRQGFFSLNPFLDHHLQIRFRLASDGLYSNQDGGIWLDDLVFSGVVDLGSPVLDDQPCRSCPEEKVEPGTHDYVAPRLTLGEGESTLLSLMNVSTETVTWSIFLFSAQGQLLSGRTSDLQAGARFQEPLPSHELAGEAPWLFLTADASLDVWIENQTPLSRSAYRPVDATRAELLIPHIARDTVNFGNHVHVVHPFSQASEAFVLSTPSGGFQELAVLGAYGSQEVDLQAVLGEDLSQTTWASLSHVGSGLAAVETFFSPLKRETDSSLALGTLPSHQLFFPHVAVDTSVFWTGAVVVNSGTETQTVSRTFYSQQGDVLTREETPLGPGEKHTLLFDHQTALPEGSAWLHVVSSGLIQGYELFGSRLDGVDRFSAGLPVSDRLSRRLTFSRLLEGSQEWSGLVVVNTGASAQTLSWQAWDLAGEMVAEVQELLPGHAKVTLLPRDLFPQLSTQTLARVTAQTDAAVLTGFLLWGDQGGQRREFLSAITPFLEEP